MINFTALFMLRLPKTKEVHLRYCHLQASASHLEPVIMMVVSVTMYLLLVCRASRAYLTQSLG